MFNQTPFYAESGGQEGDHGTLTFSNGATANVINTTKNVGTLHVHSLKVTSGTVTLNTPASLNIDGDRRQGLRAHHSATHLLHAALRHHLGDHVTQKGSLVAQDRLRFDFTHTKGLSKDDLKAIEQDVNRQVLLNTEVETHLMTSDDAIASGAMALFGEKYGDEVRVLKMGQSDNHSYSVELCGGTHAHRTGDIGLVKILSEAGVSAGVRRIEAVAGMAALDFTTTLAHQISDMATTLRCPATELQEKIDALISDRKSLEKQVSDLRQKVALSGPGSSASSTDPKQVGNYKVISRQLKDVPAKDLKPLADQLKKDVGSGIVIVTSIVEDKVALVIGVTDDLTSKINAVDLARCGSHILGGTGGGGRPDMAQAGGSDGSKIAEALSAIEAQLQ